MKFVHATDPHLTSPGIDLWGMDPGARLSEAFADMARIAVDAAFCVITGDLTQDGAPEAYADLRARLPRSDRMPVKLMLGNHDDREAFRAAFPDRPVDEDGFVQWVEQWGAGRFLFLDTLEAGQHVGRYCARRCAWLADQLARAAAAGEPVYLFLHHPPFAVFMPGMDLLRLADEAALSAVIADSGAEVRHMFLGHLHRPISGTWRGIPFSAAGALSFRASDAFYDRPVVLRRGPGSYGLVEADERQTLVHMHDFTDLPPALARGATPDTGADLG